VHPEHQTADGVYEASQNDTNLIFMLGLAAITWDTNPRCRDTCILVQGDEQEGKTFHTAVPALPNLELGIKAVSVVKGRMNFTPKT
jgi:hypothetical protein